MTTPIEDADSHVLCRLEIGCLEKEVIDLRERVRMLQDALESMWRNEVVPHLSPCPSRTFSAEVRERWRFYHEQKLKVAEDLCSRHNMETPHQLAWGYVKKETDRLWQKAKPS